MGFLSSRCLVLWVVPALLLSLLVGTAGAQGLQTSPYSAADVVRRGSPGVGTDLAPSKPLGAPGSAYVSAGSDFIPLSSGMFSPWLPLIPNLEFGFLYNFGPNLRTGRFTADYVLPISLGSDSILFGEAHGEFQTFWQSPQVSTVSGLGFTATNSASNNRTDLSFGGGFRTIVRGNALLGVNGFYDTSRLFEKWRSSGGVGIEMASTLSGNDAINLNFNYYGNIFTSDGLVNAFRNKGGSWDAEVGYSTPLLNETYDLRLKLNGYQFDVGSAVYGWLGGADLTTRNGMFTLRYEHGHDRINGDYNTVGGFVNVGFQLEKVLKGESPITMPEPIFGSPRNLRRWLTQKVKRNWHQPTAVVLARQGQGGCSGQCCNLDRLLTVTPSLEPASGGAYTAPNTFFTPVPHDCLDPTKHIMVELDYTLDVVPTGFTYIPDSVGKSSWLIIVTTQTGTGGVNYFNALIPTGTSGHLALTLDTPPWFESGYVPDQSSFTSTGTDPGLMMFALGAPGTSSLTITNVVIHFNQ